MVNIFLNFLFIPKLGAQGAAIATVASYMVVFLIRVVNTEKRYVKICTHPLHMGINFLLLIGQTVLLLYGNPRLIPISQVIFCLHSCMSRSGLPFFTFAKYATLVLYHTIFAFARVFFIF